METSSLAVPAPDYHLTDDLSRLCLPQEYRDANRRLAWVNSICALFLVIGLAGLKPPKPRIRELPPATEFVPVVIQPPVEPPKEEEKRPEQPPENEEIITDQPVVATVVAANPAQVAFAVPVQGPVILAPAHLAAPPPHDLKAPVTTSGPTKFVPSTEDWGGKPRPEYPSLALRRGYQGKVVLEVIFDASGALTSAQVKESSGYKTLDDAALEHTRANLRLRAPPGETRSHTIDIIFQLR